MARRLNSANAKKVAKGAAVTAGIGGATVLGYSYISSKSNGASNTSTQGSSDSGSGSGVTDGTDGGGTGSGSGSGSNSSSTGDSEYETKVVDVPIDNYEEALAFANREWNKIKREDGRQLDVKVLGSCYWKVGEWCKVYLPTFDLDGFMYITRTSQNSDGGDWTTNLTLVDYPPGWGKEELPEDTEDEDEDSEDEDTEDESDTDDANSDSG